MCLKQQGALKGTWAFIPETKAKSYCLALVLHCSPALCVSPPMAPSHSLFHALDWGVPLQQQPAYLWDWPFAKDLCSSRGFKQRLSGSLAFLPLENCVQFSNISWHCWESWGMLRNHSILLLAPYTWSTVQNPWNCNSFESSASENQDQTLPQR